MENKRDFIISSSCSARGSSRKTPFRPHFSAPKPQPPHPLPEPPPPPKIMAPPSSSSSSRRPVFGQTMQKRNPRSGPSSNYQRQFHGGSSQSKRHSAPAVVDEAAAAAMQNQEQRAARLATIRRVEAAFGLDRPGAATNNSSSASSFRRRGWLYNVLPTTVRSFGRSFVRSCAPLSASLCRSVTLFGTRRGSFSWHLFLSSLSLSLWFLSVGFSRSFSGTMHRSIDPHLSIIYIHTHTYIYIYIGDSLGRSQCARSRTIRPRFVFHGNRK